MWTMCPDNMLNNMMLVWNVCCNILLHYIAWITYPPCTRAPDHRLAPHPFCFILKSLVLTFSYWRLRVAYKMDGFLLTECGEGDANKKEI